ncbi:MAG: hypothetical protein HPY59_18145 [Anaerolineae bacterium]|nr:hypothetical protein [Anaerolineae bacterium]
MDKNKSHQFNFAFEAIPILFHSQTNRFMEFIERDGLKFLRFWWDHVGDRMDEADRTPFEGMNFEIQQKEKDTKLVIITLPRPRHDQDAYFLALLAKPERRFAWVRLPNTRAFVLQRRDSITPPPSTVFGELTPQANFRTYATGIETSKTAFKKAVEQRLRRK